MGYGPASGYLKAGRYIVLSNIVPSLMIAAPE